LVEQAGNLSHTIRRYRTRLLSADSDMPW
jgi:hypothetical protein